MDFRQIQDLIKLVNKSDLTEVKVEKDDVKITIRKGGEAKAVAPSPATTPAQSAAPPPPAPSPAQPAPAAEGKDKSKAEAPGEEKYIEIKSPMIGTFYRSPSPDKDPFVKVGDVIKEGEHICIIEAMKLFNEIESDFDGKIVKVLVEDATPVEYDQPLFLLDPTGV